MAQYDTKSVLLDLMKQGGGTCADCGLPLPQWCSLSFAIYVCLTCSGVHRSLGSHVSFVRSLTMDKWTDPQVERMKAGGNAKWQQFARAQPEYSKDMSIADKYQSHFAAQYKDKLTAEIEGRPWDPSMTPRPASPAGSSSLRAPRNAASSSSLRNSSGSRNASAQITRSNSPLSPSAVGGAANPFSQKAQNESYFAGLGAANASRAADLPPSQGGRYQGFGSDASYTPSSSTGGRALPGLDDLRDDPMSALSKGWGFLGAALGQATKTINESVVQPTVARANDPNLQSQLSSYLHTAGSALSEASRRGGAVLASGLEVSSSTIKREMGYDVGDLGAHAVRSAVAGPRGAYAPVEAENGFHVPSPEMQEAGGYGYSCGGGDDDFFGSQLGTGNAGRYGSSAATAGYGSTGSRLGGYRDQEEPAARPATTGLGGAALPVGEDPWAQMAPQSAARAKSAQPAPPAASAPAQKKKDDDWDEW